MILQTIDFIINFIGIETAVMYSNGKECMKKIDLQDLVVDKSLDTNICHSSGEILHRPGEVLNLSHLTIMEECGIDSVIALDAGEDPESFKQEMQRKSIQIEDIPVGEECPVSLVDKDNKVVLEQGRPIKEEVLTALRTKGVNELYYQKDEQELMGFQYEKYITLLESDVYKSVGTIQRLEHPKERALREKEQQELEAAKEKGRKFSKLAILSKFMCANTATDVSVRNLKRGMMNKAIVRRPPLKPSFREMIRQITSQREKGVKKQFIERYRSWIAKEQELFFNFKTNQAVSFETVDSLAKDIIASFAEDSFFHCNLTNRRVPREADTYMVTHSLNVCLLSICLASVLGYNPVQILEIAVGALLHDIGHVSTSKALIIKEKLDSSEQQRYDQHSLIGLALLKNINTIPLSTAYCIYQHHEKIDGSGRILHCNGDAIHDFAKIIAVADTFDRLAGDGSPIRAMSAVIKMGKLRLLDMVSIKGLLIGLSLFPIGSLVLLTGNVVGRIVATNGTNFKQPVVQTICKLQNGHLFELDTTEQINLATTKKVGIIKDVTHEVLRKDISRGF